MCPISLYTQNMNLFTYIHITIPTLTALPCCLKYILLCKYRQNLASFPLCNLPTPMPSMQIAAMGLCMYSSTVGHIHMCTYIYILVSCLCTNCKGLHTLCLTVSLSQPRKNNPASSICERGCGGMHEDIYYLVYQPLFSVTLFCTITEKSLPNSAAILRFISGIAIT